MRRDLVSCPCAIAQSALCIGVIALTACAQPDEVASRTHGELRREVLGMDDVERWSAEHGTLAASSHASEGAGAIEVGGRGVVMLTSDPVPYELAAPTAVEIDVMPPPRARHGLLSLVLSSASARVRGAVLGVRDVSRLPSDAFSTLRFEVPARIGEKIAAEPRDDVQVTIVLIAPLGDAPYVLDNVRFVAPCPTPVAGEPESLDPALAGDCGVLWASGYERGDAWADAWGIASSSTSRDPLYQALIDGEGALSGLSSRVTYPAGLFASAGGTQYRMRFDRVSPAIAPREAAYLRYYVRFDPGFDFVRGGKLPGLVGGEANTGGDRPDGTDGWSARMMWRANGRIVQYVYHPDQPTDDGEDLPWDAQCQRYFEPGRWHCVETMVQMNSVSESGGAHDGVVRSWLDGELALERTDMRFRDVPELAVDSVYFSTFFGGGDASWAPARDQHATFDGFVVSDSRIGCGVDVPPLPPSASALPAIASSALVFDSDGAGWSPGSFSTGGIYDFHDRSQNHTPGGLESARVQFTAGAFGAAQFTRSGTIDPSAYTHVVLWVMPTGCDLRFRLGLRNGSTTLSNEVVVDGSSRYHEGEWRIGEWNMVAIPMADLAPRGPVNRLVLKADSALGDAPFYVDDVQLAVAE